MWSVSTCVTISNSKWRSSGESRSIRDTTASTVDGGPPSMRIRWRANPAPYSMKSASPWAAGSISMANIVEAAYASFQSASP